MTSVADTHTHVAATATATVESEVAKALQATLAVAHCSGCTEFTNGLASFNAYHAANNKPAAVVVATTPEHVVQAVKCAAAHSYPVAILNSGHGQLECFGSDCIVINIHGLNSVQIDAAAKTARVGGGARWRDVIGPAAEAGFSTLCGSTSDVGVVGYCTGGGWPLLGRKYGFGADNVVEFDIVTGDGVLRTCSPTSEPDLFWAVRGGKGSFGIVTSITVRLIPITTAYAGAIIFEGSAMEAVLRAYVKWVDSVPEAMGSSIACMRLPPLPGIPPALAGKLTVHLTVTFDGPEEEGKALLEPIRSLGLPTIMDTVQVMPLTMSDKIHNDPEHPVPFYECGLQVSDLPAAAVDKILEVCGPAARTPLLLFRISHFGGCLAREPEHPNAVGARNGKFAILALGMMVPQLVSIVPPAVQAAITAMEPWRAQGNFLNFLGHPATKERMATCWTPENYERLLAIKKTYDSANLFRFGHTVLPAECATHSTA